jgi:cell division protein FtsB
MRRFIAPYLKPRFLLKKLRNKYVIATLALLLQLTFLESVDLFTLYKQKRRESQLRSEVRDMQKRVEGIRQNFEALNDPLVRERYAREVYQFKKDNEVIFLLSNE